MRYEFKPSFDLSVKSLNPYDKEAIKETCGDFVDLLETHGTISKGLGLKNLHGLYWEIRRGLRLRILFRWETDLISFVLAGSHDHIKNFLKTV